MLSNENTVDVHSRHWLQFCQKYANFDVVGSCFPDARIWLHSTTRRLVPVLAKRTDCTGMQVLWSQTAYFVQAVGQSPDIASWNLKTPLLYSCCPACLFCFYYVQRSYCCFCCFRWHCWQRQTTAKPGQLFSVAQIKKMPLFSLL